MTREQIEELREAYAAIPAKPDSYWVRHVTILMRAAERALVLEEVLTAGKKYLAREVYKAELRAAIDRAEGK